MSIIDATSAPAKGGVYQIRNRRTGEVYIGASQNMRRRVAQHASLLRNARHKNPNLQAAWDAGDELVFEVLKLEQSKQLRFAEEQARIANALLCYNVTFQPWRTELALLSKGQRRNIRFMSRVVSIDGSRTFNRSELAERFGVSMATINAVIRDEVLP